MTFALSQVAALAPDDPRVCRPSYRALVESYDVATVVFDDDGLITYVSPLAAEYAGRPAPECLGENILDFVDPDELDYALESLNFALTHPERARQPIEVHFGTAPHRRLLEVVATSLSDDPDVRGTVITVRDVTRQRTLEDILDAVMQGRDLGRTLELIAALGRTDLRGSGIVIDYCGTGAEPGGRCALHVSEALLDAGDAAGSGQQLTDVAGDAPGQDGLPAPGEIVVEDLAALPDTIRTAAVEAGVASRWRAALMAADGRRLGGLTVWSADDFPPSPSEQDCVAELARTAGFALDRWQKDRQLEHAATHDGLTSLPNRVVFERALDQVHRQVLDSADDERSANVVLFIDLDGFKAVNDLHGHLAGDHLLIMVAARLRQAIAGNSLVARLAGDEFAVLCRDCPERQAAIIAEQLISVVSEPIGMGDRKLVVGASIGIAAHSRAFPDGARWLDAADAALRRAKAAGKGRWNAA